MATQVSGRGLRSINYGIRVFRPAANLPQSTNAALFTVTGGKILVTAIVGEVTTAIQNQANNTNLTTNSTAGNITSNMCAAVDVANAAVGTLLGITGVRADAAQLSGNAVQPNELVVQPGTIRLVCAASNTGQMSWTLVYVPLDDGATVAAA